MITNTANFNSAHVIKPANATPSVHDKARIDAAQAKRDRRAARKEADRLRNAPVTAAKPAPKKRAPKKTAAVIA